jgi:hypothetical protein
MKTTTIRRAVLCFAATFALLFSPVNALVVRADDGNTQSSPGKGGKRAPVEDFSLEMLLDAMESLWLLLPM